MEMENTLATLAAEYLALRAEKFRRQGELKAIEERIDKVNEEINEVLKPLEITSFDFRGQTLYQKVDPYPKILPNKFDEFLEWLKAKNEEGIAKLTIHHGTLKSWYDSHPEYEEELVNFLSAYQEINVNVKGDDQQEQRARAKEEFAAKWGKAL